MKKSLALLTALILVMALALPAAATEGSTTLTVVLPDSYTLTLTIRGKGTVRIGDTVYQKTSQVTPDRLEPVTITVTPQKGWELYTVSLDGKAQTIQKSGWSLKLDGMTADMTLAVRFTSTAAPAPTGDRIWLFAGLLLLSAAGLVLCLKRRK